MTIGCRTNAIFGEAVGRGLEMEMAALEQGFVFPDRRLSGLFGGDAGVLRELQDLRDRNAAGLHYELGAYHNALLYTFLVDFVEAMHECHDGECMAFCDGRYLVRQVDGGAFEAAFFADTDFVLPSAVVNDLAADQKEVLGLDESVFGVANALQPHAADLEVRPASLSCVEAIVELTATEEAELRRCHAADPGAVAREVAAMGWIYRGGESFPYWPPWLSVDAPG